MTLGTVRFWLSDEGWGVIDSDETPGGCFALFSQLEMQGYRSLDAGQTVEFDPVQRQQDEFSYVAMHVSLLPADGTQPG